MRTIPSIALILLAFNEGLCARDRHNQRTRLYLKAQERAKTTGRKLLVIGDPDAGLHTRIVRAYGCGDECLDLNGCEACAVEFSGDITKTNDAFADDSRVVYVACVLEYVEDYDAGWEEVLRIAGGEENLFVSTVQPGNFTSSIYPGSRYILHPQGRSFVAKPIPTFQKIAEVGILAGLVMWAFWPEKKGEA